MGEPKRTCLGCRAVRVKRELIRLVRVDGQVLVDSKGRVPGRGAYACRDQACIESALRRDRLTRAFRVPLHVSGEALARLRTNLLAEAQSLTITR